MTSAMPPEPPPPSSRPTSAPIMLVLAGAAVLLIAIGGFIVYLRMRGDEDTVWPRTSQFRPGPGLGGAGTPARDVDLDAAPGVYAFQDFQGWHLWIVNGDGIGSVTGRITSDEDFANAEPAIDGAGTVEITGSTIDIDLPDTPELVGVDFNTGFYAQRVEFDLRDENGPIDPDLVTIGKATSTDEMPFTVEKVPESEASAD